VTWNLGRLRSRTSPAIAETVVLRRIASYWRRSHTESVRWSPRLFSFSAGAVTFFRAGVRGLETAEARWSPLPWPSTGSPGSSLSSGLGSGSTGDGFGFVGRISVEGRVGTPRPFPLFVAIAEHLRE
jgi:hypothetical protein